MFVFFILSIISFAKGTLVLIKDFNIVSIFITLAYYFIGTMLFSLYKNKYSREAFKEELNDFWQALHKN